MNHCLLEVTVQVAPTIRYTQDNQTAIAEMIVSFDGLRPDDPQGTLKVVGWGNLAKDLQNGIQTGQKLIIEGRLRMNTIPKQDGTKEKKAEFTLAKMHFYSELEKTTQNGTTENLQSNGPSENTTNSNPINNQAGDAVTWDSSPLIPNTDDIPF